MSLLISDYSPNLPLSIYRKRSGHRRGKKGGDKQEYLWGMWMKKPWKKEKREKLLAEDSVINN